jgi:hypothetical protein
MKYTVKLHQILEAFVTVGADSPCQALHFAKFHCVHYPGLVTWKHKGEIDAKDVEEC